VVVIDEKCSARICLCVCVRVHGVYVFVCVLYVLLILVQFEHFVFLGKLFSK